MNELKTGTASVSPEEIALVVWMLVNHPWWLSHIKPKLKNPNFEDSAMIHGWMTQTFDPKTTEKLRNKLDRACRDEDTFINQHMLIFNEWSEWTKQAICRAMLHESHGTRLEPPQVILQ
jgi:hypothetical protein